MDESLNIYIPFGFNPPTEEDIKKAKRWVLLRESNAAHLSDLVQSYIEEALDKLVAIGYKYNVKPADFQFSADEKLREEAAAVLDELEEEVMLLIEGYSINESDDKKRHAAMLPWLLALHSKGTTDLQSTLHKRVGQFLYDTEAQIAAMMIAGYPRTRALMRIKSTMHAVYTSPEVIISYKYNPKSMYLRSHGVHEGNTGLSSSGAVNIENLARQTAQIAWMKSQLMDFEEQGAVGYYQFRGSTYPCHICDSEVGFHPGLPEEAEYPHAHCVCYRVPIFNTKQEENYVRTIT